jgi:hypothetical protein
MASLIPKFVKKEIIDVWVAETWKLMLLTSTHVPNAGTQQYVSSVSANEVAASGAYTAGGVAIAGKASTADGNNYYLDATDKVIGPNTSLNYRYGILYKDTTNPATSPIRAQIDFLTNQIVSNGTSTIQWNALGIIHIS